MKLGMALLLALFSTSAGGAQVPSACKVLKWRSEPYSQSAHIIRNHIVYSVQSGDTIYEVARRSEKIEMNIGQQFECRFEKNRVLIWNKKDKETKYNIVGSEPAP